MCKEDFSMFAADSRYTKKYRTGNVSRDHRDLFQHDRDRIILSKSFRRLRSKTQVFVAGYDDYVRNRLTHSLEVSAIATSIATSLGLNIMLTDAIALGHDLGHTPFGHVGERVLDELSREEMVIEQSKFHLSCFEMGFKHNWHSLRVVDELERHKRNEKGLNLTHFTRWGIVNHSNLQYDQLKTVPFFEQYDRHLHDAWTVEAVIVAIADEIAQRHHDIEDGLITGLIDKKELLREFRNAFPNIEKECGEFEKVDSAAKESDKFNLDAISPEDNGKPSVLIAQIEKEEHQDYLIPLFSKLILSFYEQEYIKHIKDVLEKWKKMFEITNLEEFYNRKNKIGEAELWKSLRFEESFKKADDKFQEFLKSRILNSEQAEKMDGKSRYVIKQISKAYLKNPHQLPDTAVINIYNNLDGNPTRIMARTEPRSSVVGRCRKKLKEDLKESRKDFKENLVRTVIDYIAGMSDDFALYQYEVLYGSTKPNRF